MLAVVSALACELTAAAAGYYLTYDRDAAFIAVLCDVLLFSALVVGLIALGMIPLVLRLRQTAPPRGVTVFAIVVGVAPIVGIMLRAAR
jgi:hypothetical protein